MSDIGSWMLGAAVVGGLVIFLRTRQQSESEASPITAASTSMATPAPISQIEDDIVVIAAAAHAAFGAGRIVHIEDHRGGMWSAEGRWAHQTSHGTTPPRHAV